MTPLQLPLFGSGSITVREARARGAVADHRGNILLHPDEQDMTLNELQAAAEARGAAYRMARAQLDDQASEVAA